MKVCCYISRTRLMLCVLFLGLNGLYANDPMQTLLSNKDFTIGGYIAPTIVSSPIASQWGVLLGGRGAVIINEAFAFGGTGSGVLSGAEASYTDASNTKQIATLSMGMGGLFFEYIWDIHRLLHFSVSSDFLAVGITEQKKTDNTIINNFLAFGVVPRLGIEFNITKNFMISIVGAYRFILGGELTAFNHQQLWGPELGFFLKIGAFQNLPPWKDFKPSIKKKSVLLAIVWEIQ